MAKRTYGQTIIYAGKIYPAGVEHDLEANIAKELDAKFGAPKKATKADTAAEVTAEEGASAPAPEQA